MKKITLMASVLLLTVGQAFAQKEFKLAKSSGKLVINNVSNLKIEGYEGKEIIFYSTGAKAKTEDPRAAGLSALSNSGFDNTGIGITIAEKENATIVTPIEKRLGLTIKLPMGVALSIKTSGLLHRDSSAITLSNIKAEIDASTQYENFKLKNISGPISLKTLYGNIEGKLDPSFKGPISLVSVYGFIDVTVPENAKADLAISSQYDNLYAAKDLKLVMDENPVKENTLFGTTAYASKVDGKDVHIVTIDGNTTNTTAKAKGKAIATATVETSTLPFATAVAPTPPSPERPATPRKTTTIVGDGVYTFAGPTFSHSFGGSTVSGKLNGGGEKIILKSTYGKIYLRK